MEYWEREIILSLAAKAEKPIRVDENCLLMDRDIFARVCVELDLTKPIVLGVNVGEEEDLEFFFQPFVYEKLPLQMWYCWSPTQQLPFFRYFGSSGPLKTTIQSFSAE